MLLLEKQKICKLLFFVDQEFEDSLIDEVEELIQGLAASREWQLGPPAFVSEEDNNEIYILGGLFSLYSAYAPTKLPEEVDRIHLEEVKEIVRQVQGFSAESYAVELQPAWSRAQNDMATIQERRCSDDVPGDTQRFLRVSNTFGDTTFKHVLLPVWIAAFRYNGKVYRFLVNGQTGKVSGNAPYSVLKITLFVLMCVALVVAGIMLWMHLKKS